MTATYQILQSDGRVAATVRDLDHAELWFQAHTAGSLAYAIEHMGYTVKAGK